MKPIQLVLLGVAAVAAIGAGFAIFTMQAAPPQIVEVITKAPELRTEKVLVAAEPIPMGTELNVERLTWQDWPASGVTEGFITEEQSPEAIDENATAIARASFFAGEPIREAKLVRSDSGYLSAILPSGKQAVSVRVSAETAAGGFILPNDYVDVIMTFRNDKEEWITERVLENVRVLAIDQAIEEEEGGSKTRLGDTATLELTPEQTEIITVSGRMSEGALVLSLRSVEDAGDGDAEGASHLLAGSDGRTKGAIRLIRFGKADFVRPPQ
ncbi:Flp pilus assembly protein CpaB [Rhizobiaceae bacterium]|nr:Flp pilus assembly protein CpaB [Rhizobiaceae bacterium]